MRPTRISYCLFLCALLFSPLLPAANAQAGAVFTLDETIGLLNAAADGRGVFRWDPFFQEGSFSVGGHHGIFSTALTPGQDGFLMMNNRDLYAVPLPHLERGELVFPEAFVVTAKEAFVRTSREVLHYRISAIVIDPGHGGRDPGAVFEHVIDGRRQVIRETDIVLNASRMLRDMLVRRFPDKRILMTRERDITLSLNDRALMANSVPTRDNEAIIFISMHANYATNRNARGFEVWHITPTYRRNILDEAQFPDPYLRGILNLLTEESFRTESIFIAQAILDGLQETMGHTMPNRGLKEENWFVVRRSNMPAVLVELGFISNRDDAILMTNNVTLRRMVEGVYRGIVDFVDAFERSGGFIIAQ
ncbi:MAG: N-acetylmuramoyl-L-alanine amidase [Treponema sp.]|nr:N-acetylmuramoyl-L-alanine amidase [Treponema sp.]